MTEKEEPLSFWKQVRVNSRDRPSHAEAVEQARRRSEAKAERKKAAAEESRKKEKAEARVRAETTACANVSLYRKTLTWRAFEVAPPNLLSKFVNVVRGEYVDETREIEPGTRADVDTSGTLLKTHRSTLGRTAAGAVVAGPIGAIVGHAAKKTEVTDTRRVYLSVVSDSWSELFEFHASYETAARKLAQAINCAAQKAKPKSKSP